VNQANDASIHLFSVASLKPLGQLAYHRESCQTIAFASPEPVERSHALETDDDDDEDERELRHLWMASGSKDRRVALWSLVDLR
jgi:hypothetical protein